jgi:prepilin-type N-terminal cleavage/methylation domain-containing protein
MMRSEKMRQDQQKQTIYPEAGFTLIEVLIVIAIFSIGILGAMSMQTGAIKANANTRKISLAFEYATDTMELLMQIGGRGEDNKFGIDDDLDGSFDEADESELSDGLDNDDDGTVDEADEEEWHQLAEFQEGTGYTRGGGSVIPANDYYASIFNLTWDITDIDCDTDGRDDAKRIDMTVTWDRGNKSIQLSNIRANMM